MTCFRVEVAQASAPSTVVLILETIGKFSTSSKPIFDEGGVRIIRKEHTISLAAILTDSELTNYTLYSSGDSFSTKLAKIEQFLTSQRLVIDVNEIPSPVKGVTSSSSTIGRLVDSHNGPKTTKCVFETLAGSGTSRLTWEITFTTSVKSNTSLTDSQNITHSSETRLDIDEDGDITILVSGTMYADHEDLIKDARDSILFRYTNATGVTPDKDQQSPYNVIDGYKLTSTFNIAKNGRSATYMLRYVPVKSNSAYPIGVRKISFEQTLNSTLGSTGPMGTGGFYRWHQTFSGSITIPYRMLNSYAWYVVHYLVQQKLKDSDITMDLDAENDAGTLKKLGSVTRVFPLSMKFTHNNFQRKFRFSMTFLTMSTLSKIFVNTNFFSRLENDYYKKTSLGSLYRPQPLSRQWLEYNRHHQLKGGSGDEITEGPWSFDHTKAESNQPVPLIQIKTQNFDSLDDLNNTTQNYPTKVPGQKDSANDGAGVPFNPYQSTAANATKAVLSKQASWLMYEQDYEIVEDNYVESAQPVEDISPTDYQSSEAGFSESGSDPAGIVQASYEDDGAVFRNLKTPASFDNLSRDNYTTRASKFYLVVRGKAVRANYKIPMPEVAYIAGKKAYRVGRAKYRHKEVQAGSEYPTYVAMWESVYTIDGSMIAADVLDTIKTNGVQVFYA